MIRPHELLARQPRSENAPGLWRRYGVWAMAQGIIFPRILVDRGVETRPGFEALMYHEGLHVHERHALGGCIILLAPIVGWILWALWWRREIETRADAFALFGAGYCRQGESLVFHMERALSEFRNFLLLHPHPTGRWWRWVYGQSREDRLERSLRRLRRMGWIDAS